MDSIGSSSKWLLIKKKKRNEKIGEERLIRLSTPRQDGDWLITQRKMEENACFFTLKKCAALFFRTRRWLTSFHRDGGRRNGSNRGDRIEDLISADASEDYIEKLV